MKAPEYIKNFVLAECKWLHKSINSGDSILLAKGVFFRKSGREFMVGYYWHGNSGSSTIICSVHENLECDSPLWLIAYRILGLEARDAAEDAKVKEIQQLKARLSELEQK